VNAWNAQAPSEPKSETALFIEHALERAREVALLDLDPVLPRLPTASMVAASSSPPPLPIASFRAFAETTIDPSRAGAPSGPYASPAPLPSGSISTVRAKAERPKPKTAARARTTRWPVRLCALVALGFAAASFFASPLGHRPEVRAATSAARADAARAVAFFRAQLD
jgi:hypothetical protein